jgi:hypothetical protein
VNASDQVPAQAEGGVDTSNPDDEGAVPPRDGSPDDGEPGGMEPGPFSDLPPEWADLRIPDDASALAAEATAIRLELARERRLHRWQWLLPVAPPRSAAPLWGLLALALASIVCLVAAILPGGAPLRRPAPLATSAVPPGRHGGLLPDMQLWDGHGTPFPARDLRPGVVLLVGDDCDCEAVVAEYTAATAQARVRLLVVGDTRSPLLPDAGVRGRVVSATDPAHRLRYSLAPSDSTGPRAVLVRADGVIVRDVIDGRNVVTLRADLAALT